MNAADVVGYVVDGEICCTACTPSNEADPIFHDSESDHPNHCIVCDEIIQQSLTSKAVDMMLDRMEDYLVSRQGSEKILHQWCDALKGWGLDPAQEKVRDLCFWATSKAREV